MTSGEWNYIQDSESLESLVNYYRNSSLDSILPFRILFEPSLDVKWIRNMKSDNLESLQDYLLINIGNVNIIKIITSITYCMSRHDIQQYLLQKGLWNYRSIPFIIRISDSTSSVWLLLARSGQAANKDPKCGHMIRQSGCNFICRDYWRTSGAHRKIPKRAPL